MSAARKCDVCGDLFEPTEKLFICRTYKCYGQLIIQDLNIKTDSIVDIHTFDICPECNKAIFDVLKERGLTANDQNNL